MNDEWTAEKVVSFLGISPNGFVPDGAYGDLANRINHAIDIERARTSVANATIDYYEKRELDYIRQIHELQSGTDMRRARCRGNAPAN